MNADDFRSLISTQEFQRELEEMSTYLMSIKQERPIVYLIAKQLWKRGVSYQLEGTERKDLWIDGKTRLEFKFHYDCDILKLDAELKKLGDKSLLTVLNESRSTGRSTGWSVSPKIYEDICERKPDLFVWVICSRDLFSQDATELSRVCWSREQVKYNKAHSYNATETFSHSIDQLFVRLQAIRPFRVSREVVSTNGVFRSAYHFFICDFAVVEMTTCLPE